MEPQKQHSLLTKILLILLLLGCIGLAIKVVVWAQIPEYCEIEFIAPHTTVIQATKIFEQQNVVFEVTAATRQLSILLSDSEIVTQLLGPDAVQLSDQASQFCWHFQTSLQPGSISSHTEFWQSPLHLSAVKLIAAGLLTITLILLVVRPLLRYLIYPNGVDTDAEEHTPNSFNVGEQFSAPLWFGILGTVFWSLLYCIALLITMAPTLLKRNDVGIIVISIFLPALSFYQIINGMMSAQYYWSTLIITDDGFMVKSRDSQKKVSWSNVARVKVVTSSSVIHVYDKDGKRVYSTSTDLEGSHRLCESIRQKTNIDC